jgi:hypothetical protein
MTEQVMPGPSVGITTLWGLQGRPSRQSSIGCGWKARPFAPVAAEERWNPFAILAPELLDVKNCFRKEIASWLKR